MYIQSVHIDRSALASSGSYVADLPFLRCLEFDTISFPTPITFFVGENGSGKSTLLEAIAILAELNPEGGSKNFCFSTRESHSDLHKHMTLIRNATGRWRDSYFLRAESFFNVATQIEEMDRLPGAAPPIIDAYGGRSLHEQSHGESFFALMQNRFKGNGLYLLDEPEAALSPARQIAMLGILKRLIKSGSQFLISTHSPILTAFPGACIYELSENGLRQTEWHHTENTILMKRFLTDPDWFWEML